MDIVSKLSLLQLYTHLAVFVEYNSVTLDNNNPNCSHSPVDKWDLTNMGKIIIFVVLSPLQQDNIDRSSNHIQADIIGPNFQQSANRSSPNHQGWCTPSNRNVLVCTCVCVCAGAIGGYWIKSNIDDKWHMILHRSGTCHRICYWDLLCMVIYILHVLSYVREYKKVIDMTWESGTPTLCVRVSVCRLS